MRTSATPSSIASRPLYGLRRRSGCTRACRRRRYRAAAGAGRRWRARRESDRGPVGHGQAPALAEVVRGPCRHEHRRSAANRAEGAVRGDARLSCPDAEPAARGTAHRSTASRLHLRRQDPDAVRPADEVLRHRGGAGHDPQTLEMAEQKYDLDIPLADLFLWGTDQAGSRTSRTRPTSALPRSPARIATTTRTGRRTSTGRSGSSGASSRCPARWSSRPRRSPRSPSTPRCSSGTSRRSSTTPPSIRAAEGCQED